MAARFAPAVVALVSLAALHVFAAQRQVGLAALALVACWYAITLAVSRALDAAESGRRVGARIAIRGAVFLAAFAGAAAFVAIGQNRIAVGDNQIIVPPSAGLLITSVTTVIAVLLRTAADAVSLATSRTRYLRRRLYVATMACGAVASVVAFYVALGVRADDDPNEGYLDTLGVVLVMSGPMAWLLARPAVRRITDGVEETAAALRRFTGGDAGVELPVDGHDELAQLRRAFNEMASSVREKLFLERAFGRYVTHDVLDALKASGGLTVAPERREGTVLFADIRGFTQLSERRSPEAVLALLDRYFAAVTSVVEGEGGYVNKFIGDAVMVVFGAPVPQPDHAARGVRCALGMHAAIARLNAAASAEDQLNVGIGVNTGPLVAGTLGGANRSEYTVIGDAVNVASRLCSAAAAGQVVVSDGTWSAAQPSAPFGAVEELAVKNRAQPVHARRFSG